MAWTLTLAPHGSNPGSEEGRNEGGMVVYLVNGGQREEVARVAWMRENSTNPDVAFQDQLDNEVAKAKHALAVLEELTANQGTLL
jgi:hypothetical protein